MAPAPAREGAVKRAAILVVAVLLAIVLSPWLIWNFVRYMRDGFDAYNEL